MKAGAPKAQNNARRALTFGGFAAILAGIGTLVAIGGVLWLRTPAGNAWLLATLLALVAPARGTLTATGLSTDLFTRLELSGLELRDPEGALIADASSISMRYNLGGLPGRRIRIDDAAISGIHVHLVAADGGCRNPIDLWDLPAGDGAPWTGIGVDIDLRALAAVAEVVELCTGEPPLTATSVLLTGSARLDGTLVTVSSLHLAGAFSGPAWTEGGAGFGLDALGDWNGRSATILDLDAFVGPQRLKVAGTLVGLDAAPAGTLQILAAHVEPEPFAIPGIHGPFDATGTIRGLLDDAEITLDLITPGGAAAATGGINLQGPKPTWTARITLAEEVDLSGTVEALKDTRVAGTIQADGVGLGWPDDLVINGTVDLHASRIEGAGPYAASGGIRVENGVIDAPGLTVTTPAGTVLLSANIEPLRNAGRFGVIDTDIDLAALAAYGVPGLRGRVRYTGEVWGDWTSGLHAGADGLVRGRGINIREALLLGELSGPVEVSWHAGAGQVGGTFQSKGLHLPGADVRASAAEVTLRLQVGGTVTGDVQVRAADVQVPRLPLPLLVANANVRANAVAFAVIAGSAAPEDDPGGLPAVERLAAEGVFAFAGELTLSQARIAPSPTLDWRLTAPAHITLLAEGARLDLSAAAAEGPGTLRAVGIVRTRGDCDLAVSITQLPLASLRVLDPRADLSGALDLEATLKGPLSAPISTLHLSVPDLAIPGVLTRAELTVDAATDPDALTLTALLGPRVSPFARLAIDAPLMPDGDLVAIDPAAPFSLAVTLPPRDDGPWRAALDPAVLAPTTPPFRIAAELTLAGSLLTPTAKLTSGLEVQTRDGWVRFDADAGIVEEVATLRIVANQQLMRRAEVTGTIGVALSKLTGVVRGAAAPEGLPSLLSNLSLDVVPLQLPLSALGAPASVKGSLLGGLHVSGDPLRPKLEGALMVINGALGEVGVSPAILTLVNAETGYHVDAQVSFAGGGSVLAGGFVPVEANFDALDTELSRSGLLITVGGDGIPLRAASAILPGLSDPLGMAKIQGTIEGQVNAPKPRLSVTLNNGGFTVDALQVRYTAVNLRARIDDDEVVLETLDALTTARAREINVQRVGALHADGGVALDGYTLGAIFGTLELRDAWVANRPDYALRASANMKIDGRWPKVHVRGRVDVEQADIVLGENFFGAESSLRLDPAILLMRGGVLPGAATAVAPPPAVDVDLDVQLDLNRHADIDVTIPMEQFGGELTKSLSNLRFAATLDSPDGLRLHREGGVTQVSGLVEPLSGVANVLGKTFDLAGGSVSFTGVDPQNPLLGLSAVYESASHGDITAYISGPAQSPAIAFSSDQGLSDDDMISVLLFGFPLNELQSEQDAAILAAVQSLFRSQVNEAASLTRLDVLELSSDRYAFGKRFGKDVLVEVVINPNATISTTPQNPVELKVQVPLWKGWYLEGAGGTGGIGTVSAYSRWRF